MQLDLLAESYISRGPDQGKDLLVRVSRQLKTIGHCRDASLQGVVVMIDCYDGPNHKSSPRNSTYGNSNYFTCAGANCCVFAGRTSLAAAANKHGGQRQGKCRFCISIHPHSFRDESDQCFPFSDLNLDTISFHFD